MEEHYKNTGLWDVRHTKPEGLTAQNDLEKYFLNDHELPLSKWWHYFEIYDRHFSKYRNKDIVILEIGVLNGGSLRMWKEYFGPGAKIYGIDINPACKQLETDGVEIFIGSQTDAAFLNQVKEKIGKVDVLIDDGGHTMDQQITSFEHLYSSVKDDGVYLCEDLHTSYWYPWGGGLNRPGTFIEMSKNLVDKLNHWHCKDVSRDHFCDHTYSMHYYDSVLVIEKRKMMHPFNLEK